MRATVFHGPGDVRVEEVPDPAIEAPTDALVRVTHACICGSDLWPYRGVGSKEPGTRIGHELMGRVEEVGAEVHSIRPGDLVLAPFAISDGTCEFCREGLQTSCLNSLYWGADTDGGQGEAVRAPYADGTLVALPPDFTEDDERLPAVLPLTDVMGTGHHAARSAGVRPGMTVAVVGDGAVGLCGVLAAARLGAERVIVLGRHEDRTSLARRFGATDVVPQRGEEAIAAVRELTGGRGAHAVLECVGTQDSFGTATSITRDGGGVGFVGVPQLVDSLDIHDMFGRNLGVRGGVAPVRAYLPELLADVVAGTLDPSPVLDLIVDLDGVPDGYAAMDARRAIKVMVRL
ncbi:MAG: zinc-dependent alcohol dehydrogenase family protein [Mycobacteriales bacterium]